MVTGQKSKQLLVVGGALLGLILLPLFIMAKDVSLDDQSILVDEAMAASMTTTSNQSEIPQPAVALAYTMIEALPTYDSMSAAEALTNGRPTLFYFQPVELCQIRYCRQPADIAGQLWEQYQDQVNFVHIPAYALPDYEPIYDGTDPYPQLLYTNWDLYPIPPYSDWLPQPAMTEFGLSLKAPLVLLVDQHGALVYEGSEFFTRAEIEPELQKLGARQIAERLAEGK